MDVHGARGDVALGAPDGFQQLVAAVGVAPVREEELQQVEFGRGEREFPVPLHHAARIPVQAERPDIENGRFGVHLLPPEVRLHPRYQLARAEGLGHVIVPADFQAQHAVHFVRAGGEEQDGDAPQRGRLADLAAQLEAIHLGQHDVEHHQVRLVLFEGLENASGAA